MALLTDLQEAILSLDGACEERHTDTCRVSAD